MDNSKRLKELRKATGLNQTNFGALFGIPMRTVQNWETGLREPAEYIVNMIEKILTYEGRLQDDNNGDK